MIFIYDILLNWCCNDTKLYEFFEWEKDDKFTHIKRIPLFKVKKEVLNDFIYNNVTMNKDFINKFYNLTETYNSNKVEKIPYAFLLTDGLSVIGVESDKEGNIKKKSRLIIDEEEEIICISSKLTKIEDFSYKINYKLNNEMFLTRKEIEVKKYLLNEITYIYNSHDYKKLKYLYSEYSNMEEVNSNEIYNNLINSINKEINDKHIELYNLLQLIGNKN